MIQHKEESAKKKYEPSGSRKRGIIKRFLPQTLFFRSLLILVIPVLLIQVIVTTIFFDRHWSKMTSRLAFAVAGEISLLIEDIQRDESSNKLMDKLYTELDLLVTYEPLKEHGNAQAFPAQDRYTILSWENMIKKTLDVELAQKITQPYIINVDFKEKWINVRVRLRQGMLNIDIPQNRLFSSTTYIFLLWMFVTSTILLIIAILFMRNQIRPIRRLAVAAENFGKGQDVHNFKTEGAKEVRQAGQAFIEMKERIQRQISQRTEMLACVSHDLRTPLTRLKLQIAMMEDDADSREMKQDISEMEKMIDGYLNFVRGEGQEETKWVSIETIITEIKAAVERQGGKVILNLNGITSFLMLRPIALKRCLSNITSNALKYADRIWITLEKHTNKETVIVIEDNGPGIEEDKRADVFKPFFRVDSSRNKETGGVGLGLPIAMDIVHAHGGEIWLDESRYGGLAVYISLPA